jgi:C-methyltransferase C-terminal domain/Putative zinc binding domain/Methyltransferase domain
MREPLSETLKACRICGDASIENILDLGAQPPANSLRCDVTTKLPAIPLILCRCTSCGTLQLTETISPDYLFRDYVWVTGTSQVARDYSVTFYDRILERSRPGALSVIEVASNDGTFLQRFLDGGHTILGVDPARNVAELAQANGVPTIVEFFGLDLARRITAERGPADVIFARNVIPHVANVQDVIAGMAHCMNAAAIGAIEFHRADTILEALHYDSIYHEHLVYHSLHSIGRLLDQFGLRPFDVAESPVSGGSLVVYFSKGERAPSRAYHDAIARERRLAIDQSRPWRDFARRCEEHRATLRSAVANHKKNGKRLIGYGASARSSTMLNYCAIDRHCLDAVADRSTLKHDRYTPGTDIPILAPQQAFALRPDSVLLLAWNFGEEIIGQIQSGLGWHGEVMLPLPGLPRAICI